jgi:hypothetical protein
LTLGDALEAKELFKAAQLILDELAIPYQADTIDESALTKMVRVWSR